MFDKQHGSNRSRVRIGLFRLVVILGVLIQFCACSSQVSASQKKPEQDQLINALTTFIEFVQEDQFGKVMGQLSPAERAKFEAIGGVENPIVIRRLRALRLSTLAHRPSVRLVGQGLEGIFEEMPEITVNSDPIKNDSVNVTDNPSDLQ